MADDRPLACRTCAWFEPDSAGRDERQGRCRRRAPTPTATGRGVWPTVTVEDWCGEYTPRSIGDERA